MTDFSSIETDFSSTETALIMGTLLGDGHLQKREFSYRLKIAHNVKQREYVKWKHRKLLALCQTTKEPTERQEKLGNTFRFETSSSNKLKPFHELFYKEQSCEKTNRTKYVKVITEELIEKLPMDPIVLAVFYMDDGSVRNDCNAGKLATQGFTKKETQLLCGYLDKWGVDAHPVKHTTKSGQYYISLSAKTFSKFIEIIKPIVLEIPSMYYKLGKN